MCMRSYRVYALMREEVGEKKLGRRRRNGVYELWGSGRV